MHAWEVVVTLDQLRGPAENIRGCYLLSRFNKKSKKQDSSCFQANAQLGLRTTSRFSLHFVQARPRAFIEHESFSALLRSFFESNRCLIRLGETRLLC